VVGRKTKSAVLAPGEHPILAVDTAPIIYYLEGHPRFAERFAKAFEVADAGEATIVVSTVTLAEVVSGPLKAGDEALAAQYFQAMTRSRGWQVAPLDAETAMEAARVRTAYKLKLPDAIQVATAIRCGATALVTHDRAVGRIRGLRVVDVVE
jgi:predicted nucleic acid-binding protein